ncbi:TraB/GumN family protein [Cryomorpha ignava]|uniref:TraB/GumN family protein n=1 Tax=Cryomorpha ignava TaxID=101383 RepID=A0A7K3WX01_9FLAO|nr:TraB/GumN family protein [Cryomorpha ignava]NEN25382.1 TraB/GumN family protein [Cryomorpha ignava]
MKKIIFSAALLSIAAFVCAQEVTAQDSKLDDSMLWSIVNPKAPADTSYLFGTIHQISQKDFSMSDKVVDALYKSEALVTEVDLSNPDMVGEMMSRMTMKDGMTLEKLLSKKEYASLNGFMLEGTGQSLSLYNDKKPFVTSIAIMNYFIDGAPASYDLVLTQMAVNDSMKILGLESISQQMDMLDKMSYKEQAKYLMELVDESEKTKALFGEMVSAYKGERLTDLSELLDENMHSEEEKKVMITDRNKNWVPLIEYILQENRSFFAVGSGHLAGKSGLIYLLRAAGFEVEPVFEKVEE